VTNSQGNSNSIVSVIAITPKALVASLQGGDRGVRVDRPLVLSAAPSRDPDAPEAGNSTVHATMQFEPVSSVDISPLMLCRVTRSGITGMVFTWACTREGSQAACFTGSELSSTQSVITIPAASLVLTSGSAYVFSVTITKGSRTAVSPSVSISTSALPLPAVSIQPVPSFVNVASRVVLRGAAVPTG